VIIILVALGMTMGRVDRKPDPQKNKVRLNLTHEPAPAGENWNLNQNPSGFGSGSGARRVCKCIFLIFVFIRFFLMFYSGSFHGFFGFQVIFGSLSDFFIYFGCTRGWKTKPTSESGSVRVRYGSAHGCKNESEPTPIGSKTHR
jgi:hypothetical protein